MKVALDRLHHELTKRTARSSSDSAQYFRAALEALRKVRGSANSSLRLECLQKCCFFFYQHGEHAHARDAADQHEILSRRIDDPASLQVSHSLKGILLADLGNLTDALSHYSAAFQCARECEDALGECKVMNNIGVAMNYAGLYHDAVACFLRVLELASKDWEPRADKAALSNLAQSYLHLSDPQSALKSIERCLYYPANSTIALDPNEQSIREFTYVRVALELEEHELARRHAESCRQYAYAADSFRGKALADIAAGLCDVCAGNVQQGLRALETTLAESPKIDSIHSDALVAIVKAYDHVGQPEIALRYMEMWMTLVRQRRASSLQAALSLHGDFGGLVIASGTRRDLRDLEHKVTNLRLKVAERQAATSQWELLERLAATSDLREDNSGQHGYRVGALSRLLAEEIGLEREIAEVIEPAARLHDFGKTGIPERVLGNSQSLKDVERQLMRLHTVIGAELLAKSKLPQIKLAETIARNHHEWWDGNGYPDKLAGKNIPIAARIVALADVLDALTHGRPYAAPWSMDRALQEIRERRGTQFDPWLTDRFLAMVHRLRAQHADLDSYLGKAGMQSPFQQARERIRGLLGDPRCAEAGSVVH